MKTKKVLALLTAMTLLTLSARNGHAQSLESVPPVVVKTFPESGSKDVSSGEVELKVVFSKAMMDKSWSPSSAWQNSTPEIIGQPKYDSQHKTWTLKVKLEPGKTYGYWLNSGQFHNFKDAQGHAAVPYLLVFATKGS